MIIFEIVLTLTQVATTPLQIDIYEQFFSSVLSAGVFNGIILTISYYLVRSITK